MKKVLLFRLPLLLFLLASSAFAGNERISLFNGENLDGWSVLNCEAGVKDGHLFLKSGNGLVQSEEKYRDFVLEFDWKPLGKENWDSGVYFRYSSVPEKTPWPRRYQANLLKGKEGNVGGLVGATSKGLVKGREWNTFKLTVQGSKIALQINGKEAWKADGLKELDPGFIAFQAEVPGGGQHLFRNIYLTELASGE